MTSLFAGLLIVGIVAVLAPLIAGLVPRVSIPSVALEVSAGIVLGPFGFEIVQPDASIHVLSTLGLAFLLFLAAWRSSWSNCVAGCCG